jgi:hypothetical protein
LPFLSDQQHDHERWFNLPEVVRLFVLLGISFEIQKFIKKG